MITSQYGCTLEPETAVFDADGFGPTIGFIAIRKDDGARRFYMLHQVRADGGIGEIHETLRGLPYVQDGSPEFQEALER